MLLILMLLGAGAEMAAIGTILPFLSLLAEAEHPGSFPYLIKFFANLGAKTRSEQIWAAALLFGTATLLAGSLRLCLSWSSQKFISLLGHELSVNIQQRILLQPYSYHLAHSSSHSIATLDKVNSLVQFVLPQLMLAGTAAFMTVFIMAALIYVDPVTAIAAGTSFSLIYLLVSAVTRRRLGINSEIVRHAYEDRIRIIQESVGGIRDVIVDDSHSVYLQAFSQVDRRFRIAGATTAFIANAPRFVIEAAGMIAIALVTLFVVSREGSLASALPVLGAIAIGAQRLLPLVQQVYQTWANVSGYRSMLSDVLDLARLPAQANPTNPNVKPLRLHDRVSFEQVCFAYPSRTIPVLEDISFEIPRGCSMALIGKTGSGKSTLADLLMGLIEPTHGRVTVDGVPLVGEAQVRWRKNIAHVPQAIFLADTTITRNIAFGCEPDDVDPQRIMNAAAKAQLHTFVSSLPEGYETLVGERGIQLSGGQRQRLGIARAIYKEAPVLILDEATSALDNATEAAVMQALQRLGAEGRTIIMIAHRLTTVSCCDLVGRIDDGRLVEIGTHSEVIGGNAKATFAKPRLA